MFDTFEQARRFVEEKEIEEIDLKFVDLWGRLRHLTIPETQFTPNMMERGVGFDGFSVGFLSVDAGDMVLVPDLATGFVDPFCNIPTLSFLCIIRVAGSHDVFVNDPRDIARRAEEHMIHSGMADESRWGPELEFWVFDSMTYENKRHRAGYQIESSEARWRSSEAGHGHYSPHEGGYHAAPPQDSLHNLRSEICRHLRAVGVPVKYHHHEAGVPGQCEIETPMQGLLSAADAVMLGKYVTRMTAQAHGKTVTFMPKPFYETAGTALHFHQHLWKDGRNLFYGPGEYGSLSQIGCYYVGGLLTHSAALLALTNPSTNSYLRLVPGYEAPVNVFFSQGNRSAAIRIPCYATQPDTVRIEFRPPDATCNVYLAMAAQLMAGLDGILNEIDPTKAGFGPIDDNIFAWPEEQRAQVKSLPTSLQEATQALAADHDFLLAGDIFSAELLEQWIARKMQEHHQVHLRPHPYEMELYYEV